MSETWGNKKEQKQNRERKAKGRPTQRGKAKVKLVKAPDAPTFLYTSECCKALAAKKACVKDVDVKFEDRKAALGSWRCSNCKRKCKVTRSLNKEGVKLS